MTTTTTRLVNAYVLLRRHGAFVVFGGAYGRPADAMARARFMAGPDYVAARHAHSDEVVGILVIDVHTGERFVSPLTEEN